MKKTLIALAVMAAFIHSAHADTRKASTVYQFRKTHACPATGKIQTTCPGWVINHIDPLSCGGPDTVENLEWEEKAASYKRDVIERKYCPIIRQQREAAEKAVRAVGGVVG